MARNYSLDDQIRCVQREIAMRRRVFPKRVAQEAMKSEEADWQIECMEAVLATLEEKAGRRLL